MSFDDRPEEGRYKSSTQNSLKQTALANMNDFTGPMHCDEGHRILFHVTASELHRFLYTDPVGRLSHAQSLCDVMRCDAMRCNAMLTLCNEGGILMPAFFQLKNF